MGGKQNSILSLNFKCWNVRIWVERMFEIWKTSWRYLVHVITLNRWFFFPFPVQTKGSYDFILQSFDSYSDYMDYTLKERMTQTVVSFGFAIPGIVEFGFNYNNAKYTKSVQKIRRASGKVRFSYFLSSLQPSYIHGFMICSNSTFTAHICLAVHSLTALWGPKQNWSWPSTCWSQMVWCFTLSSCSACAPCHSHTFTGNTERSSETTAPTTWQRRLSVDSLNTPSSWTKNVSKNQVMLESVGTFTWYLRKLIFFH